MNHKIKMYTSLVSSLAISAGVIGSLVYGFQNIWDSNNIGNSQTESIKQELGIDENQSIEEYFSKREQTGSIVDTEWNNGEEIIINEEIIASMPTVETEITKTQAENFSEWKQDPNSLPKEVNLDVIFYPQAPDADWSLPWKEACEESSIALAYHFVMEDNLTKAEFKEDILEMVELENQMFGKYIDTSVEETAQLLEEYYDYTDYKIIDNPSIDDLKRELSQWHPIVAPFAGKELGNSFFTNGGPRYHMLVIVGYNEEFFLTNDVWTSRGENFAYSYDTIMNALHDLIPEWEWDIRNGEKRVLVLK